MKRSLLLAAAATLVASQPHAELLDRDITGDGIADAYYDTVLNISWLADASSGAGSTFDDGNLPNDGRFTWEAAAAYVASLNVGGVTDWRLPTALPTCLGYCQITTPDNGNELGYHRSVNLGGPYYDSLWLHHNANYDLFSGITQSYYWTATRGPEDPWADERYAIAYQIDDGYTGWEPDQLDLYVWAVHDGDVGVSPVPEPSTLWLVLTGGLLTAALRGRRTPSTQAIATRA